MVIILFAAPLFAFIKAPGNVSKAIIYVNNKAVKTINLNDNQITKINSMEIEVKEKKIRVIHSNCPNKICVHAGWISNAGQSLICLPNRTLIEIPLENKQSNYDVISY